MTFTPFLVNSAQVNGGLALEGYRWRNDDGSETTATWLVAQDTAISLPLDQNVRLRVIINAEGIDPASKKFQWEYRKSTDTNWSVLASGSGAVRLAASANIADGGVNTTAQLTPPSGKSTSDFVIGKLRDDANSVDTVDITTDDYTEIEVCLQASTAGGATASDVYQFRVTADLGDSAAAFSQQWGAGPGTGQNPTIAITVAGANPVIIIAVGLNSTTADVSSITWGAQNAVKIKDSVDRTDAAFTTIWAIAAPAAGSGNITVNKDTAGIAHQIDVLLYTNANQSTPCPTGDAVSSVLLDSNETLSPTNVGPNDVAYGAMSCVGGGDVISAAPNQRYIEDTSSINFIDGDNLGSAGVNLTANAGAGYFKGKVAIRIVAA